MFEYLLSVYMILAMVGFPILIWFHHRTVTEATKALEVAERELKASIDENDFLLDELDIKRSAIKELEKKYVRPRGKNGRFTK